MAQINITITYPDNAQARIVAALRAHYGEIDDGQGGTRQRTAQECVNAFEAGCRAALKDIVLRTERESASKSAAAAVQEVDVQ